MRVVFTPAGNVVGRLDFEPFGGEVGSSAGAPPERFTGNQREPEAGLDYFHARQYQPRTGRFTGVDPVYAGLFDPQQWNRYAYARNSPVVHTDVSGRFIDPKCGVGSYWCPTNPGNIDAAFDPNRKGYQGGELAAAEARYAVAVDTAFYIAAFRAQDEKEKAKAKDAPGFGTTAVRNDTKLTARAKREKHQEDINPITHLM